MGVQGIWTVLKDVPDPEIPAVSVLDLGIVRSVEEDKVIITPTYSGCPATLFIEQSIREALDAAGYREVALETHEAWREAASLYDALGYEVVRRETAT